MVVNISITKTNPIIINNNIIRRVDNINELINNTYMITEDGLYIQTTLPIQNVRIFHILNGLTFSNSFLLILVKM